MSTVMFKRGDNITMDNTPIQDGLLFFNEENYKIYMDNGSQRLQYGGDTELISSTSQASSTNAFNASASVNLFLQKTTVVDTKANALAVTQNYIPLGCLAFKEMLGTSNYSSVGASVSAALINLANRASTLENKTTVNNVPFYFDYHDGKYGYNTNANRGADTFHPFSGGKEALPAGFAASCTLRGDGSAGASASFAITMPYNGSVTLSASGSGSLSVRDGTHTYSPGQTCVFTKGTILTFIIDIDKWGQGTDALQANFSYS